MELVKGVPITDYCDAVHLTPKERLELSIPVCQAIEHAHQKGITHRDVKPSNVLVTMQDGKPVPKIIDFGIAKAIEQRLTGRSLFTQHGTIMGTLEYMLRECLPIREKAQPDDWSTFNARSLLGASLLGQKRYAETELLLLSGYEGMKAREAEIPAQVKSRLTEAGERLVKLYEAWGKKDKADQWQMKLGLKSREIPANVFARSVRTWCDGSKA